MPELPEVETVRQGLLQILPVHARIEQVELRRGDLRYKVKIAELKVLEGEIITAIRRRAKYLLFETEHFVLVNHLGMTGSWREFKPGQALKHDHFTILISGGVRLVFHDPRRFGLLRVVKRGEELEMKSLRSLGQEPLEKEFGGEYIFKRTRKRKTPIKSWLMDQREVVGVGNIYASEALFRAGIRPKRIAARLSRQESEKLAQAVRAVLRSAIKRGGTTIRDFRQAGGLEGDFQSRLLVYDRAGEACRQCGAEIKAAPMGGRATYWCPVCQK